MRFLVILFALVPASLLAQPTFKLGVGSHLYPSATIELKGTKLTRSAVKDDPGFRLQFHFLKDGKTLETVDARANEAVTLPDKGPGAYAVVLELFYPSYKPGKEQKGQFKAVSNFLTYTLNDGKVKLLTPQPALVIACGRGGGKEQEAKLEKGYAYKLIQGAPGEMKAGFNKDVWADPKVIRFELSVPPETPGLVRLYFLNGDSVSRQQQITVQGRAFPPFDGFGGGGKRYSFPLGPAETKMGKIEVTIQNMLPTGTAVVSTVEFIPILPR